MARDKSEILRTVHHVPRVLYQAESVHKVGPVHYIFGEDRWEISSKNILIPSARAESASDGQGFYYPIVDAGFTTINLESNEASYRPLAPYKDAWGDENGVPQALRVVGDYLHLGIPITGSTLLHLNNQKTEIYVTRAREPAKDQSEPARSFGSWANELKYYSGPSLLNIVAIHNISLNELSCFTTNMVDEVWTAPLPHASQVCLMPEGKTLGICSKGSFTEIDFASGQVKNSCTSKLRGGNGSQLLGALAFDDERFITSSIGTESVPIFRLAVLERAHSGLRKADTLELPLSALVTPEQLERADFGTASDLFFRPVSWSEKKQEVLIHFSVASESNQAPGVWGLIAWQPASMKKPVFHCLSTENGCQQVEISHNQIFGREADFRVVSCEID